MNNSTDPHRNPAHGQPLGPATHAPTLRTAAASNAAGGGMATAPAFLLAPAQGRSIMLPLDAAARGVPIEPRAFAAARTDFRGDAVTGATPAALDAFERALATFQAWRSGADDDVALALREAPAFVMAYVLRAYLCLGSRDKVRVWSARPVFERARALPANTRERAHLAAIESVLADDYERARSQLGAILQAFPRDVLALQIVHSFDYAGGDVARLRDRVPGVLPAWSRHVPGYHAVLAMQAFGLEEGGEYGRAEEVGLHALELNPFDARAHHAIAHVFEMTGRAEAGVHWMHERVGYWAADTLVSTHCWWHLALHHLELGQLDRAIAIYDQRVRAGHSLEVADLIDAAALLWRVDLALRGAGDPRPQDDGDLDTRWAELADVWAPHIEDRFCSFNDLHAMLAFVGANDWDRALRLERELARARLVAGRHGETTRHVGLAACRGLLAFGGGEYAEAISLLGSLPRVAHRFGGSHAQRDVLQLTLLHAVEGYRRPGRMGRAMMAAAA